MGKNDLQAGAKGIPGRDSGVPDEVGAVSG